jgi:hypothetical protein|tara:strand:- start:1174 stop:1443 length:270 start_codon:yes stop_codon:yes gene_type:complete
MKNKIINRFIVSYFTSLGTFFLLGYFNLINFRIMDEVILAFIISFCVTFFMLDKKVNETNELTKSNYWNLKNELKKRVNGKRQNQRNNK